MQVQKTQDFKNLQIIKKDGQNCFLEVQGNMLNNDTVIFNFVKYNDNNEKGNRITANIKIFLSFPVFLRLAHYFLDSDAMIKELLKEKKIADDTAKAQGKQYGFPKKMTLSQGGTSATKLAKYNKSRTDGKSEARLMKIFMGNKVPFVISAELGPGIENEKGLIVPKYDNNKPETEILIPLSANDFKELLIMTREHVRAAILAKQLANLNTKPVGKTSVPSNNTSTSSAGIPQKTFHKTNSYSVDNSTTQIDDVSDYDYNEFEDLF